MKVPPSAITSSERRMFAVILQRSTADAGAPAPGEEALRQAIGRYGGTLHLLATGPAMVVIEAGQQVATDHAARAARCALALHALAGDRPLAIAMGRADSARKLSDAGVVDRASRLLAQATPPAAGAPPEIALDEVIAGLLDARFDVIERAAGWTLRGERALVQGTRTLVGKATPCVGRDWELGALEGILDDCIEGGRARAAVVVATAGMGKSRLAAELVARVQEHRDEVAVWIGRGDSLRAGSTLGLLGQALRGALGIHEGEPLAERQDRVRTRVAQHVPSADRRRVTEFLAELVGSPFPGDSDGSGPGPGPGGGSGSGSGGGDGDGGALRAARQDAQLMSEQMRRAWLDFLVAETSDHPVLLVLEDLHWGDFGTVRFIDAALRDRHDRPWMVLALARPEVFDLFPRLWAERHAVQEIRLKGLGRKASERLVRQVLGDRVTPELLEHMVQQADGNAFYLEELIRAAAEGKHCALPETVLAMVETRLARLPPEARRVLRAASVFGEVCWDGGVSVLLGEAMSAAAVTEQLDKLIDQEVLSVRPESRFPGERELAFRHVLLREGAYATLTDDNRRLGHRLSGAWLEQRGETDPMLLAGHAERGGDGERAARHYLRAAEQAFHVVDFEATVTRVGLGLACAPPPELRLALLGLRCESSGSLQLLSVTLADAEELMRSAPPGSLPWAQAMIAYSVGTMQAGRIEELLAAIRQLREATPAPNTMGKMALALGVGIYLLDALGQVAEATALEERFSALVAARGEREPLARCWLHAALGMRAAHAHDDPWGGLRNCMEVGPICVQIGGELLLLNSLLFAAQNQAYLGANAPAEQTLERLAASDERVGPASAQRRFSLAWLRADRGALEEARSIAAQLAEHGHAHRSALEESRGRWALAEVLRRMGDLDGAEREVHVALGLAVPLEQPGVLGTLAVLRLAQARPAEALAAAEDALARCAAMGGCGMFRSAFIRLAHAEALHATGAEDAARRAIADARAYLLEVAARIDDPEHKTSFLERVPENARTLALARAWLGDAPPGA